jgi:acyl-CoA synthetase (AMP-forming)/AMP-acid ligase II
MVAIMLPTCKEYLYSFYGVLLAGGVPVPLYPPARLTTIEDHMTRPRRHPQERRRDDHDHHSGGQAARLPAARASRVP